MFSYRWYHKHYFTNEWKRKIDIFYLLIEKKLKDGRKVEEGINHVENNCHSSAVPAENVKTNAKYQRDCSNVNINHHPVVCEKLANSTIAQKQNPSYAPNLSGCSCLHQASFQGDLVAVEQLLDNGIDVNVEGYGGLTPLHLACLGSHLNVVEKLISCGANLIAQDRLKFTPLHIACYFGFEVIVSSLIHHGVDVNVRGAIGDHPLHWACYKGYKAIAQLLIQGHRSSKAQVDAVDTENQSSLHYSCFTGHVDLVTVLLNSKANPLVQTVYGDTPLQTACYNGCLDIARELLHRTGRAGLLLQNIYSETALHSACTFGKSLELVQLLLLFGWTTNHQGDDGHTPLHSACHNGHKDLVRFLLSQGANHSLVAMEERDTDEAEKLTCAEWAYEKGHDGIVKLLKAYDTFPDLLTSQRLSSNHYLEAPVSPVGKLCALFKEKLSVFQLRSQLDVNSVLSLEDISWSDIVIGTGSFSQVHKGVYKDRTVAVKRYRSEDVNQCKSAVRMFCHEVSILSRLDCSYIVKFVGACIDAPNNFALVTEYISGGSLFSVLHEHKRLIEMSSKLQVALDVAKGMEYLHTAHQPVLHGDLNSYNILLTGSGNAVVADFGESRYMDLVQEDISPQPGHLRWMAPEVFTQCSKYSTKSDVFSFALCLWELLTEQLPFAHLQPAAAASQMGYHYARPPIRCEIPKCLGGLIIKAWHVSPQKRPTFTEIIFSLNEYKSNSMLKLSISYDLCTANSCSQGKDSQIMETPSSATELQWDCAKKEGYNTDEVAKGPHYMISDKNGYVSDPLCTLRSKKTKEGSSI
ncbi:serine/threonine-protein kinase TNNI3K-like [Anneissia japonica]|uniref:serine/threonine-protein kinase TNNI3K-like n=1 Tax=Anneissia japonica TaxID=1529436 RepID=UPI0014257233|nr:serine/threonine-protein kinase TNNI3K-like [Anneissia japonica]